MVVKLVERSFQCHQVAQFKVCMSELHPLKFGCLIKEISNYGILKGILVFSLSYYFNPF